MKRQHASEMGSCFIQIDGGGVRGGLVSVGLEGHHAPDTEMERQMNYD